MNLSSGRGHLPGRRHLPGQVPHSQEICPALPKSGMTLPQKAFMCSSPPGRQGHNPYTVPIGGDVLVTSLSSTCRSQTEVLWLASLKMALSPPWSRSVLEAGRGGSGEAAVRMTWVWFQL